MVDSVNIQPSASPHHSAPLVQRLRQPSTPPPPESMPDISKTLPKQTKRNDSSAASTGASARATVGAPLTVSLIEEENKNKSYNKSNNKNNTLDLSDSGKKVSTIQPLSSSSPSTSRASPSRPAPVASGNKMTTKHAVPHKPLPPTSPPPQLPSPPSGTQLVPPKQQQPSSSSGTTTATVSSTSNNTNSLHDSTGGGEKKQPTTPVSIEKMEQVRKTVRDAIASTHMLLDGLEAKLLESNSLEEIIEIARNVRSARGVLMAEDKTTK